MRFPHCCSFALIVSIAALLPACASTQLASPRECAAMGALIGGMGGAAVGVEHADSHEDGQAVTIGISGVILGAGLGYVTCALLRRGEPEELAALPEPIPESAAAAPPEVSAPAPDPCDTPMRLDSVHFDSDQAGILPDGSTLLNWVVFSLSNCPNRRVRIEAHTDGTGSESYNQQLSDRRAEAVSRFLVEHGIAAARLESEGFGELQPIAPNDQPEGRSANRRVELIPSD